MFIMRQSSGSNDTLADHAAIKQIFIIFSMVPFIVVLCSSFVSPNDPMQMALLTVRLIIFLFNHVEDVLQVNS